MQLVSTFALLAAAVHCAQAAPERKLLRTGYGSDLDFSTLAGSTAGDSTAALSSITSLLPTSSGTSAILSRTDSLASLTTGSSGLAGLTSLTGGDGLSSIGGLSSLGDLSSITSGLSSLSLPTGSTTTGTGVSSLTDLVGTATGSPVSDTLLPSTSKGTESSTAATATTDSTTGMQELSE